MKNTGKSTEQAFVERLEAMPRTVVERLRDAADLRGINGGKAVNAFKLPSDFLVTQNGHTFFAEVKSTQSTSRLSYACLQPGQRAACLKQQRAGGDWRLYCFAFVPGQWFLIPGERIAADLKAGVASIPFKDLTRW